MDDGYLRNSKQTSALDLQSTAERDCIERCDIISYSIIIISLIRPVF